MKILEVLTARRKTANRGERAAARYLRAHRYKILARNYVGAAHEIDIVALSPDRKTTVFAEVKTRTEHHTSPKEARPCCAVTPRKQQNLMRAAVAFRTTHRALAGTHMRFDVVEVILSEEKHPRVRALTHIPGAFDRNRAYMRHEQ